MEFGVLDFWQYSCSQKEHGRPFAEATTIAQLYASAAELKANGKLLRSNICRCKRIKIQTEQCHQGSRLCTLAPILKISGHENKFIDSESFEGKLKFLMVFITELNREWTQPSGDDSGQHMPRLWSYDFCPKKHRRAHDKTREPSRYIPPSVDLPRTTSQPLNKLDAKR
ncbi:hypothetical protein EAE99_010352 [Botrytis elliptica]|nr:hypothetical protein EAE99_010352 [Botrytis elliptica]